MKGKRLCCGLLLALFIMLGLSLSVFSEDSSAVSDISITINPTSVTYNNTWNYWIDCDYTCASQYNYLIVEFFDLNGDPVVSTSGISGSPSLYVCGVSTGFSRYIPYTVFSINKNCPQHEQRSGFITNRISGNIVSSSVSAKLTLTDSLGSSCPECEVCQVCPVLPENPYDNKFDEIRNAILLVGGSILAIYFFYAIYKMILGGL